MPRSVREHCPCCGADAWHLATDDGVQVTAVDVGLLRTELASALANLETARAEIAVARAEIAALCNAIRLMGKRHPEDRHSI